MHKDQMCQCAGEVDEKLPQSEVPCGQHSGRAGTKSNLWVPALETPAATQKKRTRDSERENIVKTTAIALKFKNYNQIS